MRLLHLSALGPQVPPTTINFAPRLTVIYGASETGKSYVGEAVDFMLGAGKLRYVPESDGYKLMLLGIDFDGYVVTLVRSLRGGKISVFDGDLREVPVGVPDHLLAANHSKGKIDTISHFLLDQLGLAGAQLRKNKRNETVALSFRNIAHLVIVSEERMHSRTSPVETGNYMTRTTELAAVKLLLEADDDAGLHSAQDPAAFRKLNHAQLTILDRAIERAREQIDNAPELAECVQLLARVNSGIRRSSETMAASLSERDKLLADRASLAQEHRRHENRSVEATALSARFALLDAQYLTDLQRLDMVKSAGTLLGYFDADACVFCGAAAKHQHREHAIYETAQLIQAIDAESARTRALRDDLGSTLAEIGDVSAKADMARLDVEQRVSAIDAAIAEVDRRTRPVQGDLGALISRRSELERWVTVWEQIDELQSLSNTVAEQQPESVDPVSHGIGKRSQLGFSAKLRAVLTSWNVPGTDQAEFEVEKRPDILLEGRPRADRGTGIRSVLHAGFSVALGEYCAENELPHPGFLILDTPMLTFRDADHAASMTQSTQVDAVAGDELLAPTVAQAFYDYLAESPLQSVVLENQTPPVVTEPGCEVIYFTGSRETGRAGFYPLLPH